LAYERVLPNNGLILEHARRQIHFPTAFTDAAPDSDSATAPDTSTAALDCSDLGNVKLELAKRFASSRNVSKMERAVPEALAETQGNLPLLTRFVHYERLDNGLVKERAVGA
jgi:hypothetical protein